MTTARRHRHLAVAAALAALAGCDGAALDMEPLDHASAPIIGGGPTALFPAVGFLSTTSGQCTGTLVTPRVVLTAAHCIHDSIRLNNKSGTVSFGAGLDMFEESSRVEDLFAHRFYDEGVLRTFDIGLVKLEDPITTITPLAFNREPLDDSFLGAQVNVVGFGVTDGETQTGAGTKRLVTLGIDQITAEHVGLGDSVKNICQGDSGGPTILNIDGVDTVLAVSSFGSNFCMDRSFVTRTDIYLDDFLLEVIAAWDGPCPLDGTCETSGCGDFPDPDCDPCSYNGQCASDCEKVDLDCPKGSLPGAFCTRNDDCESRRCVEAPDEPRLSYCSEVCDSSETSPCTTPLSSCTRSGDEDLCFFGGITPSAQGASCSTGDQCRSGVCHPDDRICIEECGDGFPECADPFVCESFGGTRACVFESEGGCGCQAGSSGAGGGLLALGVMVGLILARRRRHLWN